jgi:glutamate-1-semialdehyde 2,1-aminomutase
MSTVAPASLTTEYRERFSKSAKRYAEALQVFPSGVTHDGRFLTPFPVYVDSAAGATKQTIDGPGLIDFWSGHGALLLGHSHPDVVRAVQEQVERGTHYGACHESEIEWGRLVQELVPSAERVRFTSSGTEATLMAVRVARLVTGRTKVVKFAGHFHGWHDQLAPAADPPHDDPAYPTPGIPDDVLGNLVVVRPNDLAAVERVIEVHKPACVIVEATGGRWGVVPVRGAFLKGLRELTKATGTVFVMDEVITGFRVAPGGAQEVYGVTPDLTALAKVIAGGLPGGALAGRADLMEALAFDNRYGRKMKHPGTYNANPLSAAAGIEMLRHVATGEPCRKATEAAVALRRGLNDIFREAGVSWVAYGEFSLTHVLPDYDGPPSESDDFVPYGGDFAKIDRPIDRRIAHAFRCAALLGGVDCMGMGMITSSAHDPAVIERSLAGFAEAVERLKAEGIAR